MEGLRMPSVSYQLAGHLKQVPAFSDLRPILYTDVDVHPSTLSAYAASHFP